MANVLTRVQKNAPRSVRSLYRNAAQRWLARRGQQLYRTLIKPGDLVFDVGAHVGGRTGVFLSLGARVVAVEPDESSLAALRRDFGEDARVTIVPEAVSNEAGEADLFICSEASTLTTMSRDWMSGRFADYKWDRVKRIKTTTLDSLIAEHGVPAFCKIDVEGFELDVLRGLTRPVPALSIEFVSENLDAVHQCLDRLESVGFTEFNYSLGESMRMESSTAMSRGDLTRRLGALAGTDAWGDVYAMSRPAS
jgi:FkbM family methyltransferase